MIFNRLFIGALLLTALTFAPGCNNQQSAVDEVKIEIPNGPAPTAAQDNFEPGKIVTATVTTAPAESYSLYLPLGYKSNTHLPVIIFLDPHADGTLPLNLYKGLAERNNYILIGSNSSQNGMPMQQGMDMAANLVNEALNRLHADSGGITIAGFSGGAKVAMLAGTTNPLVSRIVYCGAVMPWQNLEHPVQLLGYAGLADMNYSSLVNFYAANRVANIPHYLVDWQGKHEWPDSNTFKWTFSNWKEMPASAIIKLDNARLTQLKNEEVIQQQYLQHFNDKDLAWWTTEIQKLNAQKKNDLKFERILGYISLACYSLSNRAIEMSDWKTAQKVLSIYQIADPSNKDCAALWQVYHQRSGQ